jgi:hypothetical protein
MLTSWFVSTASSDIYVCGNSSSFWTKSDEEMQFKIVTL